MKISGFEFPDDLYYDKLNSWARVEGNVVTQGLTDFGQKVAQELVYVETPRTGREVKRGEAFMSIEAGKWVGRIIAIVSGGIVEGNEDLDFDPNFVNDSPYEKGWLAKIEMSDPAELDNLMKVDSPEFKAFIEKAVSLIDDPGDLQKFFDEEREKY